MSCVTHGSSDFRIECVLAGIDRDVLHVETGGAEHGYVEDVAMSILEYYGFEAQTPSTIAQRNFRLLARAGLRAFVYRALGLDSSGKPPPPHFAKFYDRLMLNSVPAGFFSVFHEMADVILHAAQNGLAVDEHTIPDISIGKLWSAHWTDTGQEAVHGTRTKHPHVYPDYFPQALSNAEIRAWIYPLATLGEFRLWMQRTYLPSKCPKYLNDKVRRGVLPPSTAELILQKMEPKMLPPAP